MIYSSIGYYSLIFGLVVSLPIFFFSIKNFLNNKEELDDKIIGFSFLQLIFVVISFNIIYIYFFIENKKSTN